MYYKSCVHFGRRAHHQNPLVAGDACQPPLGGTASLVPAHYATQMVTVVKGAPLQEPNASMLVDSLQCHQKGQQTFDIHCFGVCFCQRHAHGGRKTPTWM